MYFQYKLFQQFSSFKFYQHHCKCYFFKLLLPTFSFTLFKHKTYRNSISNSISEASKAKKNKMTEQKQNKNKRQNNDIRNFEIKVCKLSNTVCFVTLRYFLNESEKR